MFIEAWDAVERNFQMVAMKLLKGNHNEQLSKNVKIRIFTCDSMNTGQELTVTL